MEITKDPLEIHLSNKSATEPFWIESFINCSDLKLNVEYSGLGDIVVHNITISEAVEYRFTRLFSTIFLLMLLNCILYFVFSKNAIEKRFVVLSLIGIIIFSSLPCFYRLIYIGHDLDFHMARVAEIASGIIAGNWLVKIEPNMINGYGYATPLFYPQLFLYIPAILYVIGFPLLRAYQIFTIVINAATCLIAYFCFDKIVKNKKIAVFGALLYVLAPYRISELYVAARLGEILSMVFFPLFIYGMISIYTSKEKITFRQYLPLVIGVTGVMQSHLVSTLFVGIFAVLCALIFIKRTFSKNVLFALIKSVILVVALNMWFIIPFIDSMDMEILINGDGRLNFQGSGAYPIQVFSIFNYARGLNVPLLTVNEFSLTIGVPLIIGLGIFIYCVANRNDENGDAESAKVYSIGKIVTLFAVFTIIFSLTVFPWDELNYISKGLAKFVGKVEFSWRFLSIGAAFAAYSATIGISFLYKNNAKITKIISISLAIFNIIIIGLFFTDFTFSVAGDSVCSVNSMDDFALGGTNDYQLQDTKIGECYGRGINISSEWVTVSDYSYKDGVTQLTCKNTSENEIGEITIPLFSYPGYVSYDKDTHQKYALGTGNNKKVIVYVPNNYDGTIVVKYGEKTVWRIAEIISLFALIACIAMFFIDKRGIENKTV